MSKIPFIKAKHAEMKLIEGGGGGGGTSLVLVDLLVYIPPNVYEYPVDEPIMYDGMVLMAQYEDNYYRDVTDIATYSIPKGTVMTDDYEGEVTFTYEENGVRVQTSIEITVVSGVTWANTKTPRLVQAFAAAYAGDTEILSSLAVGDIRTVTLKDGNTAHLILAKANPVTAYNDKDVSIGTAKFIVTMQEAYPFDDAPADFYDVLPDDFKALLKKHKREVKSTSSTSGSTSDHKIETVYSKVFEPTRTMYSDKHMLIGSSPPYYAVPEDTIDCRISQGGYYDGNEVDTSLDVFEQTNRAFRNILSPDEYIQTVNTRGHVESWKNSNFWYNYNQAYDFITNRGYTTFQANAAGRTYCFLI